MSLLEKGMLSPRNDASNALASSETSDSSQVTASTLALKSIIGRVQKQG